MLSRRAIIVASRKFPLSVFYPLPVAFTPIGTILSFLLMHPSTAQNLPCDSRKSTGWRSRGPMTHLVICSRFSVEYWGPKREIFHAVRLCFVGILLCPCTARLLTR